MNLISRYAAQAYRMAKNAALILGILALYTPQSIAQTAVALSPVAKQQFFGQNGSPLASGCIGTFITGTSTPLPTYTDSTGTAQNTNPIILDGGGFGNIWLSNSTYRFTLTSAGGVNCATGTLQYTIDGISAWAIINQAANLFVLGAASDPGGSAGELAYRTDLGKFRGFSTFWDSFVMETVAATLTNKTLTSPQVNNPTIVNGVTTGSPQLNGVPQPDTPGSYANYPNAPIPGNTLNNLMILTSAPVQITAPANGATGGVIGILVAGQGGGGTTGTVQSSGIANCNFDGATTAGDYVIPSLNTGGQCHDSAVVPPNLPLGTQCIGRVNVTTLVNPTGGSPITLGCDIKGGAFGATLGCTALGPTTVSNNNTLQNIALCSIPANTLAAGNLLEVDLVGIESTASAQTISLVFSLGGGTSCVTSSGATGVANNQPLSAVGKFVVETAGAGGTGNWVCQYTSSTSGGGLAGPNGVVGTPTIPINTTVANNLLIQVQMSVVNVGNLVTAQLMKSVVF